MLNVAMEYSPMWDFDERKFRGDLERAANGYKETSVNGFVDVSFFDFVDLSQELPRHSVSQPFAIEEFNFDDDSMHSMQSNDQISVVEELPHETKKLKIGSVKPLPDDQLKTRSPSSKNAEPMSPTSSQSGRKRKRVLPRGIKTEDGDYAHDDSQHSPMDDSPNPQKKRRKNQGASSEGSQSECCVKECNGSVTNRLRFSLRGMTDEDFKPDFLQRDWQKICSKCYFRNFYKNKKR